MGSKKIPAKVILWCIPRSLSTPFELSMAQLEGVQTVHEPFVAAFHIGPDRWAGSFPDHAVESKYTYKSAIDNLCSFQKNQAVFVKAITFHMLMHKELLLRDEMKQYKHVFLIRRPEEVLYSMYRMYTRCPEIFPGGQLDPAKAASLYEAHLAVYNFIVDNFDSNPLVLDAGDLMKHTETVLEEFCSHVGFQYRPSMTNWKAGEIPGTEDFPWKSAYKEATESTGFALQRPSPADGVPEEIIDALKSTFASCRPLYETLYAKRFVPPA